MPGCEKVLAQRSPMDLRGGADWGGMPYGMGLGKGIPSEKQTHSIKSRTPIIESQNGRIRHDLARFKRKTLCYSKYVAMVNLTLLLFFRAPPLSLSFKGNPIKF